MAMKPKPHIPDILYIGYQDIAVKLWDLEEAHGVYLADRSEIRIKDGLDPREMLNTVLHECLHAAVFTYGLKEEFKDDDHEEKVINALGNALTEIFTRNPALIEWVRALK